MSEMKEGLLQIQRLVDSQAEDEGLWCSAGTCAEAYVQAELRRLHAEIERVTRLSDFVVTRH